MVGAYDAGIYWAPKKGRGTVIKGKPLEKRGSYRQEDAFFCRPNNRFALGYCFLHPCIRDLTMKANDWKVLQNVYRKMKNSPHI